MLGEKWEEEEQKEAIPVPKLPEPIKPIEKKKDTPKPETKQIEIKEIKQVPEKHETPQPIVPIVKQENVEMEQFSFDFYGTNCKVYSVHHNPPDTNMHIQTLKKKIDEGRRYLKGLYWFVREISRLSLAFCINNSHKFIVLSPSFVPYFVSWRMVTFWKWSRNTTSPVYSTAIPVPMKWRSGSLTGAGTSVSPGC